MALLLMFLFFSSYEYTQFCQLVLFVALYVHRAYSENSSPSSRYKMPFTKCYAYENCALVGYYTASSGNLLPMFWDNLFVPSFLTYEDGTGRLSQNAGKKLPLLTA
jgi:hypothetical protein